jgi:predicted transcriptional regulator of viral defense system
MHESGVLERVVPGVYISASCAKSPLLESAGWTIRFPTAVVGLLSAASYYQLTDAFHRGVWLLVPKGSTVPRSRTAAVQAVQIRPQWVNPASDAENGITHIVTHGIDLRITTPERTVLDLWKYPRRVASEHALTALRRLTQSPDFSLPRFARLGRRLGGWARIEPVLQGMMVR